MNKRPMISTWYVKSILAIFCVAVIYLMIKSFLGGYEEGKKAKAKKEYEIKLLR